MASLKEKLKTKVQNELGFSPGSAISYDSAGELLDSDAPGKLAFTADDSRLFISNGVVWIPTEYEV